MSVLNYSSLVILLASLVLAQYDPYAQRPYNANNPDPNRPYDRNNPPYDNRDNRPYDSTRDRYDRPGQPLGDRERYDRIDRNRTEPYGQQTPSYDNRSGYGQGQYGDRDRDRYNQYNRTGTDPYGYDRNRQDPYGPGGQYGNRTGPYGQPGAYDRDRQYGQGGAYDRRYPSDGRQVIDDPNCCEDYCYDRDRDQTVKFGPVTAYQFVGGRNPTIQADSTQCKPVLFWSLNKHGTNIPDQDVLQRFKSLDRVRADIIQNYETLASYPARGRLCQEDYDNLRRWHLNESISYFHGKELSAEGKEELKLLARRYQNKYRDLLSAPYTESHYHFKYTNADRTYDSYQAFLEGLFHNNAFNVHAVVDVDDISRGYRSCYGGYGGSSSSSSYYGSSSSSGYDPNSPRYGSNPGQSQSGYSGSGYSQSPGGYGAGSGSAYSGSTYNSGAGSGYSGGAGAGGYSGAAGAGGYSGGSSYSGSSYGSGFGSGTSDYEYNQFKRSPEYMEVVRHVFRKLGFVRQEQQNEGLLEDIYNMCRYEKAWYPNRPSAWCAAFTKKQLDLLEYGQDLRSYFANGYGNEDVSNRLGCGILKEMFQRLQRGVDGYTSDPRVAVRFGSAGSIENLLVAMGIAKDYTPLSAQNFYTQSRRKWRTADLSPFAANLVAVLHECDSTQRDAYKVMFYLNENPMDFAECNNGLCSWEAVRSKFEDVVNRCDYCNGAAKTNAFAVVLLSVMFALLHKFYY